MTVYSANDLARFWEKVDQSGGPDSCWLWLGAHSSGYGVFCLKRRNILAHRVSYELASGAIPAGHVVRHRCDRPACVNPAHLSVGTVRDNVLDAVSRGRDRWHIDRSQEAQMPVDAAPGKGHWQAWRIGLPTDEERFWSSVDTSGEC